MAPELLILFLQRSVCNLLEAAASRDAHGGRAPLAQSAERFHGKEKVDGSIPSGGSLDCGAAVVRDTRHRGGVAQLVEQTTHNRCVAGSSPVTATKVE